MEYRTGDDLLPSRGSERKIKPKEFLREQADHRSAAESFLRGRGHAVPGFCTGEPAAEKAIEDRVPQTH